MTRRRYFVRVNDREVMVDVESSESGEVRAFVQGESQPRSFSVLRNGDPVVLASEARVLELRHAAGGVVTVTPGRRSVTVSERSKAVRPGENAAGAEGVIRAPMPGRVLKISVAAGDTVNAGTSVLVVEAMKMENELLAPRTGRVKRVLVNAGDTVDRDAPLVELE